jgi:threonine aldolase
MTDQTQQFTSDNYSGICSEARAAMAAANPGYARAYGDDEWTARAADHFRRLFETDCEVFFAFNGTAANSLAFAALCQSDHSVTCGLGPRYSRGQPDVPGGGEWRLPADVGRGTGNLAG